MKIFKMWFIFVLATVLPCRGESVKNQIKFQELPEKQSVISMEFQYSSEGKGTVLFEKRGYDWKAIVRDPSRKIIKMFDIPSSKILVIGTKGEGVIVINLKNFRFKRHRFFNHDDNVKKIKLLEGDKVLVNDFRVIPLKW